MAFNGSIAASGASPTHTWHFSGVLIRKAALSLLVLAVIAAAAVYIGGKLPSSFLPEEDYGYVYVNLQLPNAASLQRTSEVAREVEQVILNTPGVEGGVTSVIGLSLKPGTERERDSGDHCSRDREVSAISGVWGGPIATAESISALESSVVWLAE